MEPRPLEIHFAHGELNLTLSSGRQAAQPCKEGEILRPFHPGCYIDICAADNFERDSDHDCHCDSVSADERW